MTTKPQDLLDRGAAELAEVLAPAGFVFARTDDDSSSGGPFAIGEFRRDDRRLELHVRHALGLVRYHFGELSLSHEELVRGVRGLNGISEEAQSRGSPTIPGPDFVTSASTSIASATSSSPAARNPWALMKWLEKHPRKTGLAGLGR